MRDRSKELFTPHIQLLHDYFGRESQTSGFNPVYDAIKRISEPLALNLRDRQSGLPGDVRPRLEDTWIGLVVLGVNQVLAERPPAVKSLTQTLYVARIANSTGGRWLPDATRVNTLWLPVQNLPERFSGHLERTNKIWRLLPSYVTDPESLKDLASLLETLANSGLNTLGKVRRNMYVAGKALNIPESRLQFAKSIFDNTPLFYIPHPTVTV